MKYIFFITVWIGCKNTPGKVLIPTTARDTASQVHIQRDTDSINIHDPYETGMDTVRLNAVMDKIFKLPQVEKLNQLIMKTTNGAHGVSIIVNDEFNGDTSYYQFMVGDNSHEEHYENIYNYLLEKRTWKIKVYDASTDSIMSLAKWRKSGK